MGVEIPGHGGADLIHAIYGLNYPNCLVIGAINDKSQIR
jgi:hypothetical protein